MGKFDGLNVEQKYENVAQKETLDDVFEPNNFDSVRPFNKKIKTQVNKNSKSKSFFSTFIFVILFCGFVALGFCGYLTPVKNFLDIEYNYKNKQLTSSLEIKEKIYNFFNLELKVDASKIKQIEIKKPFIAVDIVEDSGSLIFKNLESVFLKCGVNGKVVKVVDALGGRIVEILCENGCTLKYLGLTYIGTKENCNLKVGDVFGASSGNVVMELYYKTTKLNLKLDSMGKIIWES